MAIHIESEQSDFHCGLGRIEASDQVCTLREGKLTDFISINIDVLWWIVESGKISLLMLIQFVVFLLGLERVKILVLRLSVLLLFLSGFFLRLHLSTYYIKECENKYNSQIHKNLIKMMKKSPKGDSYFLNKYGVKNVKILENVLKDSLDQALSLNDFHQAIKLKEKIDFIHLQKQKQKSFVKKEAISQIMNRLEEEKGIIVKQFSEEWEGTLQNILNQMKQIEDELREHHLAQYQQYSQELDKYEQLLMGSNVVSPLSLQFQNAMEKLSKMQQYQDALIVKKKHSHEISSQKVKMMCEWREKKKNKLKELEKRQNREVEGLRQRSKKFFEGQLQQRENQYERLLTSMSIKCEKIHKRLQSDAFNWDKILQVKKPESIYGTPDNKTTLEEQTTRDN